MATRFLISALLAAAAGVACGMPPAYDHVVVVLEENRAYDQVIGSPDAPFLNSLAASGALLTGMHGVTHPSQPNYLHLFSGSNQGQTSNAMPTTAPFTTPNLGAGLRAVGRSFTGFSESLPAVGYLGASFSSDGFTTEYVRKHNPWINWVAASPTGNQLPETVAQPFTSFPADHSTLPTVSFVIPNEQHNMHDGTVAQADAWLQENLSVYAAWAANNNSLLIVTWDEDDHTGGNRIPTMFVGAGVRQGEVAGTWTLHDLLRTLGDAFGTGHAGSAAAVQPIVGVFTSDPVTNVATFQQGDPQGYAGTTDAWIEAAAPTASHGGDATATVDGSPLSQGLLRFDDLFGSRGRIPDEATILSAKLEVITAGNSSADSVSLHRMLATWSGTSTWSSLGGGVVTDGTTAASTGDFQLIPNVTNAAAIFDVTESVRLWQADPARNQGWLLRNAAGTDGWVWNTSEAPTLAARPELSVVYTTLFPLAVTTGTKTQAQMGHATLAGATPIVKTGPGTLVLDRANTLSATTTVQGGVLRLAHSSALASSTLVVVAGGTAQLAHSITATVAGLDLSGFGLVDVTGGRLSIVRGPSADDLVAQLVAGRNGGSWDGASGITSNLTASQVAGLEPRAVGWMDNGDGSMTVAYAAPGDANLDWLVDLLDIVSIVAARKYGTGLPATWLQGDFNYDRVFDIEDVTLLSAAGLYGGFPYHSVNPANGIAGVPEPAGIGPLAALGGVLLGCRSRITRRSV